MPRPVSWIAFEGLDRAEILRRTNLTDTGEPDDYGDADWSLGALPSGWHILWANELDDISPERLQILSENCRVVACFVNEETMTSRAQQFERSQQAWSVAHDASISAMHLAETGALPDDYTSIRERLVSAQETSGADHADVDFLFDLPIELARLTCTFDDDLDPEELREPFTRLAPG